VHERSLCYITRREDPEGTLARAAAHLRLDPQPTEEQLARAARARARHAQPCPGVRRRPGSLWRRPCCSGARVQVQGAVQSAAAPPNGTCVQESPLPLRRGLVPSGGTACQDARATQRSKRQAETLSSSTQKPCCGLKAVRAGIQHRGDPPLDSFRPRAAGAVRRASRCCWRRPRC